MGKVTVGDYSLTWSHGAAGLSCGAGTIHHCEVNQETWEEGADFHVKMKTMREEGSLVKWIHESGLVTAMMNYVGGKIWIMADHVNIESGRREGNHGGTETKFVMQTIFDYPEFYGPSIVSPGSMNPQYHGDSMVRALVWTPAVGGCKFRTSFPAKASGRDWGEGEWSRTYRRHEHYSLLVTGDHNPLKLRKNRRREVATLGE